MDLSNKEVREAFLEETKNDPIISIGINHPYDGQIWLYERAHNAPSIGLPNKCKIQLSYTNNNDIFKVFNINDGTRYPDMDSQKIMDHCKFISSGYVESKADGIDDLNNNMELILGGPSQIAKALGSVVEQIRSIGYRFNHISNIDFAEADKRVLSSMMNIRPDNNQIWKIKDGLINPDDYYYTFILPEDLVKKCVGVNQDSKVFIKKHQTFRIYEDNPEILLKYDTLTNYYSILDEKTGMIKAEKATDEFIQRYFDFVRQEQSEDNNKEVRKVGHGQTWKVKDSLCQNSRYVTVPFFVDGYYDEVKLDRSKMVDIKYMYMDNYMDNNTEDCMLYKLIDHETHQTIVEKFSRRRIKGILEFVGYTEDLLGKGKPFEVKEGQVYRCIKANGMICNGHEFRVNSIVGNNSSLSLIPLKPNQAKYFERTFEGLRKNFELIRDTKEYDKVEFSGETDFIKQASLPSIKKL